MSLQTETLESIKLDVKQHLIWKTNTPAIRSSKTDKSMYTNQQNQQTDTNQTNQENRENREKQDNLDNIEIDTRRLNVDLQIQSRRDKSLCTNPFMINNNYLDDIKTQEEFLRPQKTYINN
tara:strand:- start:230 stop:592 length:363 start_codon:yes stop_codon:yes gene_type:complete